MGVEGLRIVITGSAVGIGAGTAKLAASRGAKVVVSDMNDEPGTALVEEIRAAGGEAIYQHCDVTDEAQVAALMQAAEDGFGGGRRNLDARRMASRRGRTPRCFGRGPRVRLPRRRVGCRATLGHGPPER